MIGYGAGTWRENPNTTAAPSAAAALLDIVVFAGGDSLELKPLSAFEQKCMLRICNRPIIWYCLIPWIEAGFRTFFLVVNEDYATLRTYLSRTFTGIDFYFVLVPLTVNGHTSTTCDGVKAYLSFKEQMRAGTVDGLMAVHDGGAREESPASATSRTGMPGGSSAASPTAGSRKAHQLLRAELAALPSFDRDALLISADTILAGIDVERFTSNFYISMASASAMFFRPLTKERESADASGAGAAAGGAGGAGGGKKKGQQGGVGGAGGASVPERKAFTYNYACVAYEEEDEMNAMAAGGAAAAASRAVGDSGSSNGNGVSADGGGKLDESGVDGCGCGTSEDAGPQHRRLHFMYPLDDRPELRITLGFAARRPNLTFAADVVDAHVYLVRHWVLELIAGSAGDPKASVRRYIMPLLARSQHAVVNTASGVFLTPDKKIDHSIPTHWMYRMRGDLAIGVMNAAKGQRFPGNADNLRVFATIFTEGPTTFGKIYRINTRDNYQAVNQELIFAKNTYLHLLDEPAAAANAGSAHAATAGLGTDQRGLSMLRASNVDPSAMNPTCYPSALACLLPDNPFTLRERLGSQQIYIVGSFIESAPPPNVYITRSVIGPNVTIAPGARITDSVIMANVDIGSKAVVSNSVVGTSAVIEAERRVTNSVVAPRCYVEEDAVDTIVE